MGCVWILCSNAVRCVLALFICFLKERFRANGAGQGIIFLKTCCTNRKHLYMRFILFLSICTEHSHDYMKYFSIEMHSCILTKSSIWLLYIQHCISHIITIQTSHHIFLIQCDLRMQESFYETSMQKNNVSSPQSPMYFCNLKSYAIYLYNKMLCLVNLLTCVIINNPQVCCWFYSTAVLKDCFMIHWFWFNESICVYGFALQMIKYWPIINIGLILWLITT